MTSVLGAGTHGDYRLTDALAGTADATYASMGTGGTSYETLEAGLRYKLPIADLRTRPFIDARATYMYLNDLYSANVVGTGGSVGPMSRYSRGVGGFAGIGIEHAISGSFLLTTELAALRNRMTTYRTSSFGVPSGMDYWATTYRFTVGFRYNAQRSLALTQNPRQ
jgi:hypothetical protein